MIFNPKEVSNSILSKTKKEIEENNLSPTLATIRLGNDFGSVSYEKSIIKTLEPLGITVKSFEKRDDISENELIELIDILNKDQTIDSILLFKPLPAHINEKNIITKISADKDPDAINPINLGKLMINDKEGLFSCTAEAVIELLDFYNIDVKGKDITIINNSDTFGKPLSMLLTNRFATVTICHIFTKDLKKFTKNSDIVITGVGKYGVLLPDMLKEGVTLIDVGVSDIRKSDFLNEFPKELKSFRAGDIHKDCKDKAKNIVSLSPGCGGGTGPITTAVLAKNILKSTRINKDN